MSAAPITSLDHALKITKGITQRAFLTMGLTDSPVLPSLREVSLTDMLAAVQLVRDHNEHAQPVDGVRHIYVVPDDRLIAAVYVAIHYSVDTEQPIVMEPEKNDFDQWVMKAVAIVDVTEKAELRGVERSDG